MNHSPPQQVLHRKLAVLVGPDLTMTYPLKTTSSVTASSIIKTDDSSCAKARNETQLRQEVYIFNSTETTKEAEINKHDNSTNQHPSKQCAINIITKTSKPQVIFLIAIFDRSAMFDLLELRLLHILGRLRVVGRSGQVGETTHRFCGPQGIYRSYKQDVQVFLSDSVLPDCSRKQSPLHLVIYSPKGLSSWLLSPVYDYICYFTQSQPRFTMMHFILQ